MRDVANDDEPQYDAELDAALGPHIERYIGLFAAQVQQAGGWPEKFRFPEPADDIEREALRLFVEEAQNTTGAQIIISRT